jgi:aryl-alcohol dehydrogenase-like predicted oxidoreductase
MEYRQLGQTDMQVSVVAMGCWAIAGGDWWGPQDENDAITAIQTALDIGVNFFDSAEGYGGGTSEELLGKALGNRRSEAIIATKVSRAHLAAADVQTACENSLRRLNTDMIDVYQIHWPSRDIPFDETMTALQKLVEQGKVRSLAVSNFGPLDMEEMLALGRYEANQIAYNMLWRAAEVEIQPRCMEHTVSILPYGPLQQGVLAGKYATADEVPEPRARTRQFSSTRPGSNHNGPGCEEEMFAAVDVVRQVSQELDRPMSHVSLAWLLHQPAVTSVIAGARNPDQIRENALASDLQLSPEVLDRLDKATQPVKEKMGSNADMWGTNYR